MSKTSMTVKSVLFAATIGTLTWVRPVMAQEIVFDPTNFTKNMEQARQQLVLAQQMREQVQNQLRMLESWRFSRIDGVLNAMRDAQRVLASTGSYGTGGRDGGLGDVYPVRVVLSRAEMQGRRLAWELRLRRSLVERREGTEATYRDMGANARRVSEVVARSNAAPGQTAAVQAGNELTASLVGQLQSLQASEVSAARAEAEEEAKKQSESAYQAERRRQFMSDWGARDGPPPIQNPFSPRESGSN